MSNDTQMQAGIAAFKAGDKAGARAHFMQVVEVDENNEQAWLWLAGAMDDPAETRICLENVLHLNPGNQRAAQGLDWLRKQRPDLFVEPAPAPAAQGVPAAPAYSAPPAQAMTGPTITLSEPAPAYSPPASAPDYSAPAAPAAAAGAPPAPRPAAPSGYQVPHADGTPALAGVTDPQPCPRCGKPTRLAERRCRACGLSLMQKVDRSGGSVAPAKIAGVMSLLHGIFYTLVGLGLAIYIFTVWSTLKNELVGTIPPEQKEEVMASLQPMLDEAWKQGIEPAILVGVVIAIFGGLGIAVSIGIMRLRPWAYWVGWIYNGLLWLSYLNLFISNEQISGDLRKELAKSAISPDKAEQFINLVRAVRLIPVVYFLFILLLMGLAWRLFTSGSARFVALDPPSGDPSEHFNRGIAYRRRGMWYQSMVEWERAVELSPSDPTYRHALGLVYAQLKRTPEAQRELAEAMSLDPNNLAIMQDAQKLGVSS
jgi:Flp pilus assembly protein TadD